MLQETGLGPSTCGCGPWSVPSDCSFPCDISDADEASAFLKAQAGQRTALPNEIISGERAALTGRCFRVLDGVVRLTRIFSDGQRQVARFAYAGDYIGLSSAERELTCEAVTNVTLLEYDAYRLQRMADCNPHVARQLAHALRAGIDHGFDHVRLLGRRKARQRLALFLRTLHRHIGLGDVVPIPMSRADIADHIGLTPETVSRAFAEHRRRRVVREIDRNLLRLDLRSLDFLADES